MIDYRKARRWAQSLFKGITEAEIDISATTVQLKGLYKLILDSGELSSVFKNPAFTDEEKAATLEELAKQLSLSVPLTILLVDLVYARNLSYLPVIAEIFEKLADKHLGIIRGELTASYELDEKEQQEFASHVEKKLGKKVELQVNTDPDLLGGVVFKYGGMVVDGSIKTRLQSLKECLKD